MGNGLSCKRKKKKEEELVPIRKTSSRPEKKRPKKFILDKDRKIIQQDKELYKVIFDAEGFSVHDLALLGLKNSPDTLLREGLKPKKMGRVYLIENILAPPASKPSSSTKSSKNQDSLSKGEFEVTEVFDYVDDLYLQLLDPDRTLMDERKDTTSNTENVSSK